MSHGQRQHSMHRERLMMHKLIPFFAILSLMSSAALAQAEPDSCSTEDPACRGTTSFGPAAMDRCLSIRGAERIDFCQTEDQTHSLPIASGDRYCAAPGSNPAPEDCELHWIIVTEPE